MPFPVACSECGRLLAADRNSHECPTCGATTVTHHVSLEAAMTMRTRMQLKVRHGQPGEVAPYAELVTEDSFSRRLGKWVRRRYRVHRDLDVYVERVVDPATGEVLHEKRERLTEHTGRGSARRDGPAE